MNQWWGSRVTPLLRRELWNWLGPLALRSLPVGQGRDRDEGGDIHLLLAIADHYEPRSGGASDGLARKRVEEWVENYPKVLGGFRDADGRPPRHTFFYPIEEYEEDLVEGLAGLCRQGYGEVEVHLHHDNDTTSGLYQALTEGVELLAGRHGLLARRDDGSTAYGFVHGNWALNNSRPDGRWCGVNDEIGVLIETGCYADFTFPSAPSATQPRTFNRIYYAKGDSCKARGHDVGVEVGAGQRPKDSLMMIPGPLGLNWSRRRKGVFPRLENACVQGSQPATMARIKDWIKAGIRVRSRPDWYFVKLHAHGAMELDRESICGAVMATFHRGLAERSASDPRFHVHYVSAREMYNLVRAAEAGWQGSVDEARDFELAWGGDARGRVLENAAREVARG